MTLPLNIDIQQIFLHMFNFVILTGGLYFLLYKPVRDFMEKRRAYYADLEKETKEKMTQAGLLKEKYEGCLADVDKEISKKKQAAAREMEQERESHMAKTKKQAEEILTKAQQQGEREKEKIVEQAKAQIADLAADATKKLLYETADMAFDEFLDRAEGSVKND